MKNILLKKPIGILIVIKTGILAFYLFISILLLAITSISTIILAKYAKKNLKKILKFYIKLILLV